LNLFPRHLTKTRLAKGRFFSYSSAAFLLSRKKDQPEQNSLTFL